MVIYTVFNHLTREESVVTQEQLENLFPELKLGVCEVIDEIDPNYVEGIKATIVSLLTEETMEVTIDSRETLENLMVDEWEVYVDGHKVYYNSASDSFAYIENACIRGLEV